MSAGFEPQAYIPKENNNTVYFSNFKRFHVNQMY